MRFSNMQVECRVGCKGAAGSLWQGMAPRLSLMHQGIPFLDS